MYPYVSASLSNTNCILFPWLLHGVCLFPVLTKPDERRLLVSFYMLSFLHMLSFLTSNQSGYVFCIALLPACLASIMLSIKYFSSAIPVNGALPLYICVTASAALLLYTRALYCFASPPVTMLDTQCNSGPSAGLILDRNEARHMETVVNCVRTAQLQPGENTLFLTPDSQFYLSSDTGLAQHSAWMGFDIDSTAQRLEAYYSLNPDKRPDAVVIEKSSLPELDRDTAADWAAEHSFSFEEDDICFFMRRLPD